MKNTTLIQLKSEIDEWKRNIYFLNEELSRKMDRMVELLKNTSHAFLIDKIEAFQQLIINQNATLNKLKRSIEEHEFRLSFSEIRDADMNLIVLQHQSYRNEFEKKQQETLELTMKFNGFFIDQLNSIADSFVMDVNSTFLQVSFR